MEFADDISVTYVMGGLAREFRTPVETMRHVLEAAAASGMPTDPRLWLEAPPVSSYPACQAVKAAADQGLDGPYLRVVREGLMVDRLTLDHAEALAGVADRVPGLDVGRFRRALDSPAAVEAFGADRERARAAGRPGERRVPFPSFEVTGEDGQAHWVRDRHDVPSLRAAVLAAGGASGPLPTVRGAVARFGRIATPEVAAVCDLTGPPAEAELWTLAADSQIAPEAVLTGELWGPV